MIKNKKVLVNQATDNYKYDASGNLISNTQVSLNVTYNILGKIEKITKPTGERGYLPDFL